MRLRRRRRLAWLRELPPWQQAAVVAVPAAGIVALGYGWRRRLWQAVGLVASAVEEVADTVEDAAETVRDTARERAAS
jgi:hypothetical protein